MELLPVEDLCAVSCTCKQFLHYLSQGRFAEQLWYDSQPVAAGCICADVCDLSCKTLRVHRKKRFQAQVGDGLLSLHQAGTPHKLPPTARYWHFLCKHAYGLDHVRWWQEGSHSLQNNAEEVSALSCNACSDVNSMLHKCTAL